MDLAQSTVNRCFFFVGIVIKFRFHERRRISWLRDYYFLKENCGVECIVSNTVKPQSSPYIKIFINCRLALQNKCNRVSDDIFKCFARHNLKITLKCVPEKQCWSTDQMHLVQDRAKT
jgi:hypothetical protein